MIGAAKQADIVLLNLQPGDHIPPHSLEIDVLFAVAEGSATLTAGGVTENLTAGDVAEVAPGENREWENTTQKACSIFVFKQKVSPSAS